MENIDIEQIENLFKEVISRERQHLIYFMMSFGLIGRSPAPIFIEDAYMNDKKRAYDYILNRKKENEKRI